MKKSKKRRKEQLSYLRYKAWKLHQEAEDALRRKRKRLAINLMERAVRIYPEFFQGHAFLGFLYHSMGDYRPALSSLLKAKEIDPASKELYYYLGLTYDQLQMLEEAIQSYQHFISLLKGKRLSQFDRQAKKEAKERLSTLKFMSRKMEKAKAVQLSPQEVLSASKEGKPQEVEKSEILLKSLLKDLKISRSFSFRKSDSLLRKLEERNYQPFRLYQLRTQANELSLLRGFDRLLCLSQIRNVEKFWYQIETAKKTLKQFRGRVLLCDEVGLGKTIEAGMILKEYLIRGLVKRVLILVPPSLIIQWKDEMWLKFDLEFVTTDDRLYKEKKGDFWKENDLIIASINVAKSRKNFKIITGMEYDLVIVDEAHHLKNRNSLNWKFVNSLKKKFILLLTATPVHNDLIELYNLITLLKLGQLKTPSSFKRSFVLRGDPRVPKNREKLRQLLSEVMIRNTRSLANINLPRRYATTVKIELNDKERDFYEALSNFVRENYLSHKLDRFTSTLLQMEAGSSPLAASSTLLNLKNRHRLPDKALSRMEELLHLSRVESSRKAEKLMEILSRSEEKVIVFTNYLETQSFLARELSQRGMKYSLFNGTLSIQEKERSINLFQNEINLLISTEIGGEGKNLHFCHTMINYDLPWNPMRIEQRIGRLHRIGQKRDVFIFNFSAAGTVEDYLLEILDKKINMFELVLGEIDMILGNLDESKEFSEMIIDIWLQASEEERKIRFAELGDKLLNAKKKYLQIKKYDEEILQHDYEL